MFLNKTTKNETSRKAIISNLHKSTKPDSILTVEEYKTLANTAINQSSSSLAEPAEGEKTAQEVKSQSQTLGKILEWIIYCW